MVYVILGEYMQLTGACILAGVVTWFLTSPDAARHRWIGGVFLGVLLLLIIFGPILTYRP